MLEAFLVRCICHPVIPFFAELMCQLDSCLQGHPCSDCRNEFISMMP